MIRTTASRILSSGVLGRRQLSSKGFQNWLLTSNTEDQKSEEIEFPQSGLSKPAERASSSFKTGSSGSAAQKSSSSSNSSQLTKVDNFKPDSLDFPYSNTIKTEKKDEKPPYPIKSSPLPSASNDKSKTNDKQQIKSKKPSKDHKKKSKDGNQAGDDKKSDEQMCSHHTTMVPPSDVLEQLKTFELKSKCTAFHLKSSGHDR